MFSIQEVNEEWLADKSRFAIDGLKRQRLVIPMKRPAKGQLPERSSWEETLIAIGERLVALGSTSEAGCAAGQIAVVACPHTDAETLMAAKDLANCMNSELV